jgi:hypothetical protein
MRDQVQRTLFTIATAAAICGMPVALVYAGLGNVRLDPTVTLSNASNYVPYCDPMIDPSDDTSMMGFGMVTNGRGLGPSTAIY